VSDTPALVRNKSKDRDRRHWTRWGTEKVRWTTETDAAAAAERTNAKGFNIPTMAYPCPVCDGWHVGTSPLDGSGVRP
jgi:hypothetical protein